MTGPEAAEATEATLEKLTTGDLIAYRSQLISWERRFEAVINEDDLARRKRVEAILASREEE